MRWLPNDVLRIHPELELTAADAGLAVSRNASTHSPYEIVTGDVARLFSVLEAVANEGELRRVVDRLSSTLPEAQVFATLEQLAQVGWVSVERAPSLDESRLIALVGEGALARAIAQCLSQPEILRVERLVLEPELGSAAEQNLSLTCFPRRPERDAQRAGRFLLEHPGLAAAELVILALEGETYATIDALGAAVLRRGLPCLFVSYEAGSVWLGPSAVPGRSAGFLQARRQLLELGAAPERAALALPGLTVQGPSPGDRSGQRLLERASREVAAEVERLLDRDQLPCWLTSICILRATGSQVHALERSGDLAGEQAEAAIADVPGRDLALEDDILAARAANLSERGAEPLPTQIQSVGIVGGGTAGYLTALALRKHLPGVKVTLIESSKIPVIGVGEATTALLNHFLHVELGLDILDFYARVQPTWKLGIRFEWGLPGDYFYNSPFQFGKLLESVTYEGDINKNCLGSLLMSANTTPIVSTREGGHRCLLSEVPYAYHLDNRRFVRYLAEEAKKVGVEHVDAVVTEALPSSDRESIDHLRTEDGRELRFDLYVDCSGFRSLLMGKALESPVSSYASSLFTDTAVVGNVPHGGLVKPYTVAETMDHGWCWNIPMADSDHRGYVFSSAFASKEQALSELRAKNPGLGDTWTVGFQSGRRRDFWRGNCVAIGNSFAFVEPLQSTAIHMIVVEIQKLVSAFPREKDLRRFQSLVNREICEVWDVLRWFLAAHYRFNRKLDSAFWRECRAKVDVSGIEELLALYRERAPIGATAHRLKELDLSTFGAYRYDLLFLGMGLETQLMPPGESRESFRRTLAATERVAARALPHLPALEVLRQRPELLQRHAEELGRG